MFVAVIHKGERKDGKGVTIAHYLLFMNVPISRMWFLPL